MTFSDPEHAAIIEFGSARPLAIAWQDSEAREIKASAPGAKGRFARLLIQHLAIRAGKETRAVRGHQGNRRWVGSIIVEFKFSMEDRPRFQQVRPPEGEYQALIAIAIQPDHIVYWTVPGDDVERFVEQGLITYQHADESRWFFPRITGADEFSGYRMDAEGIVRWLRNNS